MKSITQERNTIAPKYSFKNRPITVDKTESKISPASTALLKTLEKGSGAPLPINLKSRYFLKQPIAAASPPPMAPMPVR